jgi:hypothetical protein
MGVLGSAMIAQVRTMKTNRIHVNHRSEMNAATAAVIKNHLFSPSTSKQVAEAQHRMTRGQKVEKNWDLFQP